MSFLPSFSVLGSGSGGSSSSSTTTTTTTAISSSTQPSFRPASLSYFTIFCPALKPPKKRPSPSSVHPRDHAEPEPQEEAQNEDERENARESAQILFYTSRARAALKDRMLRQIGVAKGLVEFCSMVGGATSLASNGKKAGKRGRSWNVHSSKRRMVLVEVELGIWVHASIDLPYTTKPSTSSTKGENVKVGREYHDHLLSDVWVEESICRAWADFVLLNGSPAHILSRKSGRMGLERGLEKYFSVWAWSWDLEVATNADLTQHRCVFEDCIEGFPVVARGPRGKLDKLMRGGEGLERLKRGKKGWGREVVILSDTKVLWPATDAGCFDSEEEDHEAEEDGANPSRASMKRNNSSDTSKDEQLDPETRSTILNRVVSHLTGLERERALIRAASVSSTSDNNRRHRGTSGAIRGSSSSSSNNSSKRDIRNNAFLGTSTSKGGGGGKRIVSGPVLMQQRSASASSYASSNAGEGSSRWSNWGSVFSGLGKLGLNKSGTYTNGESTVAGSEVGGVKQGDVDPGASGISIRTADLSTAAAAGDTSVVSTTSHGDAPATSSPIEARPSNETDSSVRRDGEASSPLQLLNPIQEAGGKMWSGAELAFRGIGASLGLAAASNASSAKDGEADTSRRTEDTGDVSERDRFADASFDRSGTTGADGDDSVMTKVSILKPEVDVSELAEALGAEEEALGDLSLPEPIAPQDSSTVAIVPDKPVAEVEHVKPVLKANTKAAPVEPSTTSPISPIITCTSTDTKLGSDFASIRTSASAKAFPSISVTSAAWYNTKALRSDPSVTSSPKIPSAASIFSTAEMKDSTAAEQAGGGGGGVFDTSLGNISVQSEHHDFELDGWGVEDAVPWQSFRCFVGGESDVPISYDALEMLQDEPYRCDEFRVCFTTRRLLTLVLIEKVPSGVTGSMLVGKVGDEDGVLLEDAWQLLRRTQRVLNDYDRTAPTRNRDANNNNANVRFLHLDGQSLTFQSCLEEESKGEVKMEEDVKVVAEAHCVGAMELMRKHEVTETFSRSSGGKSWTASRLGSAGKKGKAEEEGDKRANQTYMVLAGKKISIVDCDNELRRLANVYPSFGI